MADETKIAESTSEKLSRSPSHSDEDDEVPAQAPRAIAEVGGSAEGTEARDGYEWDPVRQGYFPKIDDDFLAYYQASYGFVEEDGMVKPAPALPIEVVMAQQAAPQQPLPGNDDAENTSKASSKRAKAKAGKESDKDDKDGDDDSNDNTEGVKEAHTEGTDSKETKTEGADDKEAPGKKRKAVVDPTWFEMEEKLNNNVYVTGLPQDYSEQEFYDLMSKCGIVKDDDDTKEPKLKLYRSADGVLKGDGRCCYLKHESVALAINILDDSFVGDNRIKVQQAVFECKGSFVAVKKKKKPKKKNKKNEQDGLLSWHDRRQGPLRKKSDKVVIFHHCFDPKEFDENACLISEISDDMRAECEKCGPVHKVKVFDRHMQGVISVAFKEFEGAESCVETFNGRWFAGRQLEVEIWDGVTSYEIEETDLERTERLKKWEEDISK